VFKRVLLCHDGTDFGRRALRQGAELAISVGAEIHVLIAARPASVSPAVVAGSLGYVSIYDEEDDFRDMLSQSLERLKARGVSAKGHIARGNPIQQIVNFAKELAVDLIVVGQYPSPEGRRWWAGSERAALAESANCAVLIAVATPEP
jgi:nucleotide-binding universal stress UspA family protein